MEMNKKIEVLKREIEICIKKIQAEILDLKNICKVKNALDRLNRRMEMTQELLDRAIEIIQSETREKTRLKKRTESQETVEQYQKF